MGTKLTIGLTIVIFSVSSIFLTVIFATSNQPWAWKIGASILLSVNGFWVIDGIRELIRKKKDEVHK